MVPLSFHFSRFEGIGSTGQTRPASNTPLAHYPARGSGLLIRIAHYPERARRANSRCHRISASSVGFS